MHVFLTLLVEVARLLQKPVFGLFIADFHGTAVGEVHVGVGVLDCSRHYTEVERLLKAVEKLRAQNGLGKEELEALELGLVGAVLELVTQVIELLEHFELRIVPSVVRLVKHHNTSQIGEGDHSVGKNVL